ncbi:MAG: RNA polymerase subunit sigma-24, partial [Imperialibacter sp.]
PENPSAWVLTTARNKLIDQFRRQSNFDEKAASIASDQQEAETPHEVNLVGELNDDLLKMIFACCDPSISEENQIILSLKILCGFGNKEIATCLLKSEDAVAKSYTRARLKLKESHFKFEVPIGRSLNERLDKILQIIYLLFTEGYKAARGNQLLRQDLCVEAMRLTQLILDNKLLSKPSAHALMALMCFQASRFDTRVDLEGNIVPLHEQDRGQWNGELIQKGVAHMDKSMGFEGLSDYHLQAAIAACYSVARDFENTDWKQILSLYDIQLSKAPNKMVALNRVIPFSKVEGPTKGLELLSTLKDDMFDTHYLFHAIAGELHAELRNGKEAKMHYQMAHDLAENQLEKIYLRKKVSQHEG